MQFNLLRNFEANLRKHVTMGISTNCREGPYNWVSGKRCQPVDQLRVFENVEPRTGKALCHVPVSGAKEVDRAILAAQGAFKGWSQVSYISLSLFQNCTIWNSQQLIPSF